MNAKFLLFKTRDLVKSGWCQGMWASGPLGGECKPLSVRARHYCVVGALARAAGKSGEDFMADTNVMGALHLLRQAEPMRPTIPVTAYNDRPQVTKADVLDLIDAALMSA